jgi:hypothetical protein
MIDKMVYKVWDCVRCLRMGHVISECSFDIRCRACFSYNHIAKAYLSKAKEKKNKFGSQTGRYRFRYGNSWKYNSSYGGRSVFFSPKPEFSAATSHPLCCPHRTKWKQCRFLKCTLCHGCHAWGHQVIDGGPTWLPRTYYYAAEDPPSQHHSHYIVVMDPAPPPMDEAHWRNQVLNFLTGPLIVMC